MTDQQHESQVSFERAQSSSKIDKLKENFNTSMRDLEDKHQEQIGIIQKSSVEDKNNFMRETTIRRNAEVFDMKRNFNKNKYSAKRVTVNGEAQGFPSKLEAAVFQQLSLLEKAGEIIDLSRQAGVDLTLAEIRWKIDFSYIDAHTNKRVFAEAKGVEDERYKVFKKLWPFYGFGDLQVWKGGLS